MRPFNQGPPAMGMGMGMAQPQQQPQQQQQQQPLNANNTGFGGHFQGSTNATGVYEECNVKSIVCEGRNFGTPSQNFSSDMLRWDDYRQVKNINDGTPSLKTTFDTNQEGMMQFGLPFAGHREVITKTNSMGQPEKTNHLYKVFVCHPRINGSAVQNFCTEMERWDHMRASKQINDGTPNMRTTFAPEGGALFTTTDTDASRKPSSSSSVPSSILGGTTTNATGLNQTGQFTGYGTETVDSKGKRSYNTYAVISCKPIYEGRQVHNINTDMLRWDAYRQLKNINDGTGSLAQLFDIPPAPAQGAPGGFGGAPAAPGGFGAAPGGFGAAPAAPGGFSAAPAAPGGFGGARPGGFGAAPAAGGFGAPPAAPGGFGGGFGRRM